MNEKKKKICSDSKVAM